jgi:hypothetical protein
MADCAETHAATVRVVGHEEHHEHAISPIKRLERASRDVFYGS